MSVVAAAIIGGAVVGAAGSAYASKKASDAQRDASDNAIGLQWDMYQQQREDLAPWREAGESALSQLSAGTAAGGDYMRDFTLADFERDPGYDFRLDEGMRGLDASAAARGNALSGGAVKDAIRFNQGFASNEYTNAYNRFNSDRDRRFGRLSQLAGIGQTATDQLVNQGTNYANQAGDMMLQAGNARASGYVGMANAVNQGIGTIGSWYTQQPQQQPMGGQSWYMGGQPAAGAANNSFGTPGLDSFYYGSGTSGG